MLFSIGAVVMGVGSAVASEIWTTLPRFTGMLLHDGHDVGLGVIVGRLLLLNSLQPFVDLLFDSRGNSLCGVKTCGRCPSSSLLRLTCPFSVHEAQPSVPC